jgi:type IV/VI secretion system ImpK/VasF family protein
MSQKVKQLEIILSIISKTDELYQLEQVDLEKIAFFRDEIRKNIFFLQEELLEEYSETTIKFTLFPLIAYIDEKIMFKSNQNNNHITWNLLQLEYYDKQDGGAYVFEIIDKLFSDNTYPEICYDVVFFILQSGFQGKYFDKKYDHEFIAYKKKINSIINSTNNGIHELLIFDATIKNNKKRKGSSKRKYALKIIVPISLLCISLLLFYTN